MPSELTTFYAQLKRGPALLFLGQDYLRLETGQDPFLSEILRKYSATPVRGENYFEVLDSRAGESAQTAAVWMEERCRRIPPPKWLKVVASFPWNGICSSAFDSIWHAEFRNSWREVQPILEEDHRPPDPRNRLLLHCTFLFGCVNRMEAGLRPPLKRSEWRNQRQIAIAFARRLPELVTPIGILVVEGHAGDRDWYELNDLLPVIGALGENQTHLFSADQALRNNPEVAELERDGKLVLHPESLFQVLSEGADLGHLQLGVRPEDQQHGRHIQLHDRTLFVPRDLWNNVSRSALIVDDSILAPPPRISEDALYRELREALARTDGRPNWTAYARGLYFPRKYFTDLQAAVEKALAAKELSDHPVILHGPTGTGKTVAAATLAYNIRKAGKYPVLFIERKSQRSNTADLEPFCRWAEEEKAPACLIIWDGMLESEEYSRSLRYLTSKGRKVVLVGTCYTISSRYARSMRFVSAPQSLSTSEITELGEYLKRFHPALDQYIDQAPAVLGPNFLVTLYRLLPPTRSIIRSGLAQEISRAEALILERASKAPAQPAMPSALASALVKAGIAAASDLFLTTTTEIADEEFTNLQALTGLIMVPGQFGIRVPVELLLRALKYRPEISLADLLEDLDIFYWYEDAVGNIDVGPRNRLEARLIVQARLGGPITEMAFAKRLLSEVQERDITGDREIDFAVELLTAIRGREQRGSNYSDFFKDIADTLTELRETRGQENPRLMLQEANLLREWAIWRARSSAGAPADPEVLNRAEEVVHRALEMVGDDPRRKELRAYLLVELGSTLATKARSTLDRQASPQEAIACFENMRKVLLAARSLSQYSYYPIDVLSWSTKRMLQSNVLSKAERAEAIADLLYTYQTAPKNEFDTLQLERFEARRLEFAQFTNREELAEEAFRALEAKGSTAGYYLRALHISGLPDSAPEIGLWDYGRLRAGMEYLQANRPKISQDSRCLDLLLDLWWMAATKSRFFSSERATPGLEQDGWQYLLGIVDQLLLTGNSYRHLLLLFLRGFALFQSRQIDSAFDTFKEVERESESVAGKKRVIRSYLASTTFGQPQVFHGTVTWVSPDAYRAEVFIDEIMRRLPFFPRDFGRTTIARNEALGEFHIAFNFLGPIADPKGYLKR